MIFAVDDPLILKLKDHLAIQRAEHDGFFRLSDCEPQVLKELREVIKLSGRNARQLVALIGLDLKQVYNVRAHLKKLQNRAEKKEIKFKEIKVAQNAEPVKAQTKQSLRFNITSGISLDVENAEEAARVMIALTRKKV